jgi:hypothetical protein
VPFTRPASGSPLPYPTVETQAGSTVKVDLDVTSDTVEPVDLTVGDLPTDGRRRCAAAVS